MAGESVINVALTETVGLRNYSSVKATVSLTRSCAPADEEKTFQATQAWCEERLRAQVSRLLATADNAPSGPPRAVPAPPKEQLGPSPIEKPGVALRDSAKAASQDVIEQNRYEALLAAGLSPKLATLIALVGDNEGNKDAAKELRTFLLEAHGEKWLATEKADAGFRDGVLPTGAQLRKLVLESHAGAAKAREKAVTSGEALPW